MLTLTLFAGTVLFLMLASGAADPPRAGTLAWQVDSAADWPLAETRDVLVYYRTPVPLPAPPFTLEVMADNSGQVDSAWGVWLEGGESVYTFLVSREGYLSVSADEALHWAEFMHIGSDANKIYLNVMMDYGATLRINDEIAWRGILASGDNGNWGIVCYREPRLRWQGIALYGSSSH